MTTSSLTTSTRAFGQSDVTMQPAPKGSIVIDNIVKSYHTETGVKTVLDGISFHVAPGEKIAVLGQNGAGKSTLVRLIGGVEKPTRGAIRRGMSMSWPVGLGGGVSQTMTGLDNIRFIARLYNRPIQETIDEVDDFAELGRHLLLPIKLYSSGMRARLLFALTVTVDFDCFLIDEVLAVGDQRFQRKCHETLFIRRSHCAMILVSHQTQTLREYCTKAIVLKRGRGRVFDDLDFAISIYASL